MTNDVSQELVLRLALFNLFDSVMDSDIECTLSKLVDYTTLSGTVDMLEGMDAIQRDLEKLEQRAQENLRRIKNSKRKVLHLGLGNPHCQYRLGDCQDGTLLKRNWGYWQMASWT